MTDEEKQKIHDIVADAIEPKLKQARMEGILIGYQVCAQQMYKGTKDIHNAKDMRKYLKNYADNIAAHLEEIKNQAMAAEDNVENQG